MVYVGIVVALVLALAGALLVGSSAAALIGGGSAAAWVGLAFALVLCVLVPVLLERKLTRSLRRLEPGAKSMFFQTLAIVNGVWLALLVFAAPRFVRSALEQRGPGLIPGHSSAVEGWLKRAAACIPRSGAAAKTGAPAPSAEPSSAKPLAPAAPSSTATPAAAAAPAPIREAPEASEDTPAAKVYRERADSVVVIHTRTAVPSSGPLAAIYERLGVGFGEALGSGFVVDAAGLVVTNHHVIESAVSLQIVNKDGVHFDDVSVLRDDARNDLALLSVPAKDLAVAPLSTAKNVAIGARAIAIGSPLGFEYTLTEGIVSAHRNIDGTRFLQMQTGIAPGSSGGPLFDQHGAVIGVNTATSGNSLNLAVDVVEVKKLLDAPREAKALAHFEQGARVASLETEGGELDPTTRMNLREVASLLANIASKCAKPLPSDAQLTLHLSASLTGEGSSESNLSQEAQSCMSLGLRLLGMQLTMVFAQTDKPPASLNITIADLPRDDGSRGNLVFHFKR